MLTRKLFRTMGRYKAQFISMIIMVALGIGLFVGFNMEWVSIEHNMTSFFDECGFADYRLVGEEGFSDDALSKIQKIDGVQKASRFVSVNTDVDNTDGNSINLNVTTDASVSGFVLTGGEAYNSSEKDAIWLSDQYANNNSISVGDRMTLHYKNYTISGEVKGLIKAAEQMICVRDETQLMPDFATHGFAFISPAMYENIIGFDYYPQINVISNLTKKEFIEKVDRTLKKTTVILTKDNTISYSEAKGEASEGKAMGTILPSLFLLIGLLTMVTTMHRLTANEKTQIGTLKALGFRDFRIIRHYTFYALMVAIIGSAFGVVMGYGIAWYIMNPDGMMGTYLDMPRWELMLPWFCYVIIAGIIVLLTLVGYISVRKMLGGSAADALRPYTPKKIKPMLIEKTKIFHKLPFGTRWNMRDMTRHKSRSLMSLIGILGCTILILASFGMRDTMNGFLAMYYDNGLNYSSRIFLSEEADDKEISDIAQKYNGDFSGSVSVQLDESTVSLDIYHIENDKIRFSDKNAEAIKLTDEGAYICMRIADKFNINEGDYISVSPFGTDTTYSIKIAGIFRSVTENIVITDAYAKSQEISYKIDSVYTDDEKNKIEADNAIKSVQSKQMIMDSFESFTSIMDTMIYFLVAGALILGIIVLYNLGVMSYTERYREMATLKVVGFRDKKIGRLLIGQNLFLSILGVIIGIPCGVFVLDYLLKTLAGEYEMMLMIDFSTYIITILLTVGMSLFVSWIVANKNKKINMVEALKSTE
ncbi:MAG: FtsX-like permease family protein [Ruminococcus sp.]|nr:FtsX-like permease family protein [Ruminococcus sp.]